MKGEFAVVEAGAKKSSLVARQILGALAERRLKPGDKLPPERTLAEDMKVSRTCVREALKALEVLGLVESRVGDGTYILPKASRVERWLDTTSAPDPESDFSDMWEARAEIETAIVRLAARLATRKMIDRMRAYLDQMGVRAREGDAAGYLQLDQQFHLALARAADNALLERIIQPLIRAVNDSLLKDIPAARMPERLQVSLGEHQALLAAVEGQDEAGAATIIWDHFRNVREFYGKRAW